MKKRILAIALSMLMIIYLLPDSEVASVGTATVTIKGKENPIGTKELNSKITKKVITYAQFSVKKEHEYTGKKIKPTVKVVFDNETLEKGKDYKVEYYNNKNVGTAIIKIIGKGSYVGGKVIKFKIVK